jgi:hypothetical protein
LSTIIFAVQKFSDFSPYFTPKGGLGVPRKRTGVVKKHLLGWSHTAMASKNAPIERLGAVLDHSLKRFELSARLDEYGVWPIWNDVVGKTIALNAQPEKIRNGTLFVKVSSPVWMQQLQFMKELIVEKLNERLKTPAVKTIFFMVGHINAVEVDAAQTAGGENRQPARPVDETFLQEIADPDIREAFRSLIKNFARREAKS